MQVALVALLALILGQAPARAGQAPAPGGADSYRFSAGTGLLIFHVDRARAADFEIVMRTVTEGLQGLPTPVRRQQAQGWRFFRARDTAEAAVYVVVVDPVVPDADYDPVKMITEVAPAEAPELFERLRAAVIRVERLDLDPLR